jgi:hypothetical protein
MVEGARKPPPPPLQVGKNPVASLTVQRIKALLKKRVKIHDRRDRLE